MERGNPSEAHLELFPYHHDYYAHLLLKEEERYQRCNYKARSPQLQYRKAILKELSQLSNKLNLSLTTYHLAVHLLDIFMDHHEIDAQQLMLAASSCLLVSAKYVDVDANVPRISVLQSLTSYNNTLCEYKTMEIMLLNFWRFDLNFATVFHFLEHLLSNDLFWVSAEGLHPSSIADFKCQVLWLADVALAEVDFIFYKASVVAAACIANARSMCRVLPTWPFSLESHTGYSYHDIDECAQLLRSFAAETSRSELNPVHPLIGHVHQIPEMYCGYEEPNFDSKWKCKAPANSYNCARTKRRHLFNRGDLKKMYCAR